MATLTENVPAEYLRADGKKFQVGMDARFRGDLIRSVTGDLNDDMLIVFPKAEAMRLLRQRGWEKFLPESHRPAATGRRTPTRRTTR